MPLFPLNFVACSTLIDEFYILLCVVQDHSWQFLRIFLRDTWWKLFWKSSCLCLCAGVGHFDLVEKAKRRPCDNIKQHRRSQQKGCRLSYVACQTMSLRRWSKTKVACRKKTCNFFLGLPAFGRRGLTVNTARAFAAKYSMPCLSML